MPGQEYSSCSSQCIFSGFELDFFRYFSRQKKYSCFRFIIRKRNYSYFIIIHTVAGFLDSFDGILARNFNQTSQIGHYFDSILDQFAHILIYAAIGFLYPKYIAFFFLEVALDIWMSTFAFYRNALPPLKVPWPEQPSFLSETCTFSLWEHPNMRLFRWYGSDIFHTLLIVYYILSNEQFDYYEQKIMIRIKRYISTYQLLIYIRYLIIITSISSILRTLIGSCFMIDNWYRMASIK